MRSGVRSPSAPPILSSTYSNNRSGLPLLERGKVVLKSSPDSVFFWAVLGPMFQQLLRPFELRARLSGTLSSEESDSAWKEVDLFFKSLGFSGVLKKSTLRHKWALSDSNAQ